MKNKHIGSSFNDYLKEKGIYEEVRANATKRVLAWQIEQEMKKKQLTKVEMTKLMKIKNRSQLDRLLDPGNNSVTLLTLQKAASALGKELQIRLV